MSNFANFQQYDRPSRGVDPYLDARLHLERNYGGLRAEFRWFDWKRLLIQLPGTIIALLLFAFFIFLFSDELRRAPHAWRVSIPWIQLIFTAGFLLVSLWGLYQIAAVLFNRSRIELTSQSLTIRHGPLPFRGSCSLACRDIKELDWEQTKKTGILLFLPLEGFGDLTPRATFYQLYARLQDGRKYDLVFGPYEGEIRYLKETLTGQVRDWDDRPVAAPQVIPVGLQVQNELGTLRVTYRWFSWKTVLIAPSLVVVLLGVAWMYGSDLESQDMFHTLLVVGMLLAALYILYWALANAFNHTTIDITRQSIRVQHGPLPWPGNRTIDIADLQSLSITEKERKPDEQARYELNAVLKDGRKIKLWSSPVREHLEYLKQKIEAQQSPAFQF